MKMRRHLRAATAVAVLAFSIGLAGCSASGEAPSEAPSYDEVQVTWGDLSTTLKWTGSLTYDNPFPVVYQADTATTSTARPGEAAGTTTAETIVTWLAASGSVLDSGDVLYRVNDVPVVFVEGDAVLWRKLGYGSTGDDVEAVERVLTALGYDPYGTVTVDTYFTWRTYQMVERFQEAMGLTETGTFDYRSIIMRPGPIVVTDASVTVGEFLASGDTVLTVSDVTRAVVFPVAPEELPHIKVGDAVEIRLPNGDSTTAVVSIVSAGIDAETQTYEVTAIVSEAIPVTGDKVEVPVSLAVPIATDSLLVPSEALVVRDDGTTSVRVDRSGELSWVAVTVLGTSGQSTAVASDDLAEGDVVAVY